MSSRICYPRHATRRRPERATFGDELAATAKALGQPFMPWQREVANIAGELDQASGLPVYRQIFVTVPRQSGKTTLFLSFQVHRCQSRRWSQPQRSVYTAQTGQDARDKWRDEIEPLLKRSRFKNRFSARWQNGSERIKWTNGSLIMLMSSSTSAGHGKTVHQATLDEIFADQDDRREAGLRPAMTTIEDAQLLVCSTAGTDASIVYNRKVANGRMAVTRDRGEGLCYIEYSAPDDWDPDDEDSYFEFMPALCPDPPCRCGDGEWRHTTTLPIIRAERDDMEDGEFRRAFGNRPSGTAELVIPVEVLRRTFSEAAQPGKVRRFGLAVSEDRTSASIVASDDKTVELVRRFTRLASVVPFCNELSRKHGAPIAIDTAGPAGYFAGKLDSVEELRGQEYPQACAWLYDAVADGLIAFRAKCEKGDPFYDAFMGAAKRDIGDSWVWSRKKSTEDITPLEAATLAWRPKQVSEPFVLIGGR